MKELTVEAMVENIPMVTEFGEAQLDELDCPMKTRLMFFYQTYCVLSNTVL